MTLYSMISISSSLPKYLFENIDGSKKYDTINYAFQFYERTLRSRIEKKISSFLVQFVFVVHTERLCLCLLLSNNTHKKNSRKSAATFFIQLTNKNHPFYKFLISTPLCFNQINSCFVLIITPNFL